jgi:hypothetical protein
VNFDYASSYGTIHSDWNMEGSTVEWHFILPGNTVGWLPLNASEAAGYKLDGLPLSQSKAVKAATHEGRAGYEIPAGSYMLQVGTE